MLTAVKLASKQTKKEREVYCSRKERKKKINKRKRTKSFRFSLSLSLRHATLHPSCIIDRPSPILDPLHFSSKSTPLPSIRSCCLSAHTYETADKNKGKYWWPRWRTKSPAGRSRRHTTQTIPYKVVSPYCLAVFDPFAQKPHRQWLWLLCLVYPSLLGRPATGAESTHTD